MMKTRSSSVHCIVWRLKTRRRCRTPEMKALHADGALFIGRITSYIVEEKFIVE